ncbi:MAG: RHS repeat-associated core domain-containing protein [Acidobacteria bacterium]|nr:RHS repeat-associated core domain-containing protein [Acidobacteriota bacterium]
MTTDHLGSPRVVTNADGEVIARRDFMPFGEDLGAGVGPRTENLKYSAFGTDRVRQRFTGYEKDGETGLDFAEARMYQNRHGRFTAPDPLLASASAANPQTFNRYIYTGNNPVNITDPSGLTWCRTGLESGSVKWIEGACGSGYPYSVDDSLQFCNNASGCSIPTRTGGTSGKVEYGAPIWFDSGGTAYEVTNPTPVQAAQIAQLSGAQNLLETQTVASASASELGTTMNQRPMSEVSLGCPVSVPSCSSSSSSSSPGYQRLDTSRNEPLKTVELIARSYELCSGAPLIGSACAVGAAATRFGQGRFGDARDNFLNVVPFLGIARKADKAKDGVTIIGETMKRVEVAASRNPGSTILNNMPKFTGEPHQVTSQMMQHNRKWILQQMRSGRSILDIGADPARKVPSIFYQMEKNMIKNYQKLHPGALKVITP